MKTQISHIKKLIDDPIQICILRLLLDSRSYTAIELANATDSSAQNISTHLNKLVDTDLLAVEKQGRRRYYRLSGKEVADAIETLAHLAPNKKPNKVKNKDNNSDVRYCRTCYDHLAGKVGVLIEENLTSQGFIELKNKTYLITKDGNKFFSDFGLDLTELQKQKRNFAKSCLDWSERKHHIAGSLGNALFEKMLELDWIRKTKNSLAIFITSLGTRGLKDKFKVELENELKAL